MPNVGAVKNLCKDRLLSGKLYRANHFNNAAVIIGMLIVPVV